ncbi:MAG: hypothetical protein GKR94_12260 [Gammaproteobacteria bacterium]|nr:hypothetical protein [Gammaproteobacteria bacterium]
MDEPNASLDEAGEQALMTACRRMKEDGVTLILVSHRPGLIGLTDKVLLLHEGKQQLFGPRDQVLTHLAKQRAESNKQPTTPLRVAG